LLTEQKHEYICIDAAEILLASLEGSNEVCVKHQPGIGSFKGTP
jgi:hypothetical protein